MHLARELIEKHGIAAIPGETFGLNNGCYLRVAYAALDKQQQITGIQRLINGLRDVVTNNPNQI